MCSFAQLLNYIQTREWVLIDRYIDDGYSGTNFERPEFERMLKDIHAKKFNCILLKDLSRLGRNYILTGKFLEELFPSLGIRVIAIGDNYDSNNSDANEIIPFKNILNEFYARDISKKVKATRYIKAKQGLFMGNIPPYGYMQSSTDSHNLVPNDETMPTVKLIFRLYLEGKSMRYIAEYLNNQEILTPRNYYYQTRGAKNPYDDNGSWGTATIRSILMSDVYIGNITQLKRKNISHKNKKRIALPQQEWISVPNRHAPIIDYDDWQLVQSQLNLRKHQKNTEQEILLTGLCVCTKCKSKLVFTSKKKQYTKSALLLYLCRL